MTYLSVDQDMGHRQGDVWRNIPKIDFDMDRMPSFVANKPANRRWEEILAEGGVALALMAVSPVYGITASQDCDASREEYLTLFEVRPFAEVVGIDEPKDTKGFVNAYGLQLDKNPKFFYLPPCETLGFGERMAADFRTTIRVRRADLDTRRHDRMGRLCAVAAEHFRERIAQFYRRYPVNNWYAFDKDELETRFKGGFNEKLYPCQMAMYEEAEEAFEHCDGDRDRLRYRPG